MRIHIATDHAGLAFSRDLQAHLMAAGHEVVDAARARSTEEGEGE